MRISLLYCLLLFCLQHCSVSKRKLVSPAVVPKETDYTMIDEFTITTPIAKNCKLISEVAGLGDRREDVIKRQPSELP